MSEVQPVSQNSINQQLQSAIRDLLKVGGSILATKGVLDGQLIEPLVGLLMILGPVAWSQAVVVLKHRRLVRLASRTDHARAS